MNRCLNDGARFVDFIDEIRFQVQGGRGGNGCVSFRREKFVPKGGPDGGDGGDGGHVLLRVNSQLSTLKDIRPRKTYRAGSGGHGKGKRMHGKRGEHTVITVPPGTLVRDAETGEVLADLIVPGQETIVARGGRGGKGNARYATSTNQRPDYAKAGTQGECRELHLELKILADVGLVGLPNAGKSTLLSVLSAARPKIADYPFTTLVPQLGIVSSGPYKSFVMADIPGLIEGAHEGRGLGIQFLRHIERTRVLVFLIDVNDPSPHDTLNALKQELVSFDPSLEKRPMILALTKCDTASEEIRSRQVSFGMDHLVISSVTREGLNELVKKISERLNPGDGDG